MLQNHLSSLISFVIICFLSISQPGCASKRGKLADGVSKAKMAKSFRHEGIKITLDFSCVPMNQGKDYHLYLSMKDPNNTSRQPLYRVLMKFPGTIYKNSAEVQNSCENTLKNLSTYFEKSEFDMRRFDILIQTDDTRFKRNPYIPIVVPKEQKSHLVSKNFVSWTNKSVSPPNALNLFFPGITKSSKKIFKMHGNIVAMHFGAYFHTFLTAMQYELGLQKDASKLNVDKIVEYIEDLNDAADLFGDFSLDFDDDIFDLSDSNDDDFFDLSGEGDPFPDLSEESSDPFGLSGDDQSSDDHSGADSSHWFFGKLVDMAVDIFGGDEDIDSDNVFDGIDTDPGEPFGTDFGDFFD